MNKIFLLLLLVACGVQAQIGSNPSNFSNGIKTKLVQPDTLSTALRDALTPKLGTILYHKDTGVSRWEQWNGTNWVGFGGDLSYTDIASTNFNSYYVSQEMLKSYLDDNSLSEGYYRVKQPKEISTTDYINIVFDNGEHNAFPSITKTKEGKLILGYRASPVDHNSPNARAEIMISSDNGNSFSDPIVVDDGTDFSSTLYGIRNCFVTQLSTGDLIATYGVNDGDNGNVYYKFSSDGGETWGARTTLSVTGYTPNKISTESKWLEINDEFIMPIFSGDLNAELNAGFVRTSDFSTFTYVGLTSDTEKHVETKGYIDHSNNTIIFFYQYPENPSAVLYRQVYDPVNDVVISGQTAVTVPSYRSTRTDILFDENRGEMYFYARTTFGGPARILVSTDKGLNFDDLYDIDNATGSPVYGSFVQVSQNESLLFFATENVPNGTSTKIWGTTFNISPSQLFHYDGSNVVELSTGYLPKTYSNQGVDADLLRGVHWGNVNTDIISDSDIITTGNAIVRDGLFTRDSIARVEIIGIDPTGGIVGTDTNHDLLLRRSNAEKIRLTTNGATVTGTLSVTSGGEFTGTVSVADPVNPDDAVNLGYAQSNFATVTSGTFTPTVFDEGGGATYTPTSATGYYTRIGKLCTISVRFTSISTSGTPTGALKIGNFPFASTSVSGHVKEQAIAQVSGGGYNYVSAVFTKDSGSGATFVAKQAATSTSWTVPTGLITFTSGEIVCTLTYVTP